MAFVPRARRNSHITDQSLAESKRLLAMPSTCRHESAHGWALRSGWLLGASYSEYSFFNCRYRRSYKGAPQFFPIEYGEQDCRSLLDLVIAIWAVDATADNSREADTLSSFVQWLTTAQRSEGGKGIMECSCQGAKISSLTFGVRNTNLPAGVFVTAEVVGFSFDVYTTASLSGAIAWIVARRTLAAKASSVQIWYFSFGRSMISIAERRYVSSPRWVADRLHQREYPRRLKMLRTICSRSNAEYRLTNLQYLSYNNTLG